MKVDIQPFMKSFSKALLMFQAQKEKWGRKWRLKMSTMCPKDVIFLRFPHQSSLPPLICLFTNLTRLILSYFLPSCCLHLFSHLFLASGITISINAVVKNKTKKLSHLGCCFLFLFIFALMEMNDASFLRLSLFSPLNSLCRWDRYVGASLAVGDLPQWQDWGIPSYLLSSLLFLVNPDPFMLSPGE